MNDIKTPGEYIGGWIEGWAIDKAQSGLESFVLDLITATPILVGVSIGVYALLNMVSSKLAKLGVFTVFAYGSLVIIV